MSDLTLHLISFDIPYPPDYGGVIDVFYKIKTLHDTGAVIHLHCFEYGRKRNSELEKYCKSVNYYPRSTSKIQLLGKLPYIVLSRRSEEMMKRLMEDDSPILCEGLHCSSLLNDPRFSSRKIVVRTHNIEHDYYKGLAQVAPDIFRRYYFYSEASKLKKYEPVLIKASGIASISEKDTAYFSSQYGHAYHVPPFHPNEKVEVIPGCGNFVFYHANLGVGENNEAALFLVKKIFNDLDVPLVIAGSHPSAELKKACAKRTNIVLKANISTEAIYELIRQAQINVLPTFQATGIKLKLLAALFKGRHCLVNSLMVQDTGMEELCVIADDPTIMKSEIKKLFQLEFNTSEIQKRATILMNKFSNKASADKLKKILFG